MLELRACDIPKTAPLFEGWEETLIWSCLQGQMGRAWADNAEAPKAALLVVGDFFFLGGDHTSPDAEALASFFPEEFSSEEALLIPRDDKWAKVIERAHGDRAAPGLRYAIRKEPGVFDRRKLEGFAETLPEGFVLRPIEGKLYERCLEKSWSRDLVRNFSGPEDFAARGLGVVALDGDILAAGASSYTVYDGGIEIEIDTEETYRRRGLALACGAALILRCLERGLYPSWDAATPISVALAEKLGYHLSHGYRYYSVKPEGR